MSILTYGASLDAKESGYWYSVASFEKLMATPKEINLFWGKYGFDENTVKRDMLKLRILGYEPEYEEYDALQSLEVISKSILSQMLKSPRFLIPCDVRVDCKTGLPYMCFQYAHREERGITESLRFLGLLSVEVYNGMCVKMYRFESNRFSDGTCTEVTEIERGYAREIRFFVPNTKEANPFMEITEYHP